MSRYEAGGCAGLSLRRIAQCGRRRSWKASTRPRLQPDRKRGYHERTYRQPRRITTAPGFIETVDSLVGPKGWSQDEDELHGYETSSWGGGAGRAALLLKPANTAEVSKLLALCNEAGVGVVPQGGNTGLVGAGVPDDSGRLVLLTLRRLDSIVDVDTIADTITVGAGAVLERVQEAAAAKNRLFALNLGARGSCAIGGNLATNAGGLNVIRYGMSRDLVLGLEVVLADGTVWDGLRGVRKDNTGYDLKQLFIGSEGTLGVITAACLRLSPMPRELHTAWLGVASPDDAVALLQLCRERLGETISAFELLHHSCVDVAVAHRKVAQPIETPCPGRSSSRHRGPSPTDWPSASRVSSPGLSSRGWSGRHHRPERGSARDPVGSA